MLRRSPRFWTAVVLVGAIVAGLGILGAIALSAPNAERGQVLALLRAQARGDADGMLKELPRCAPVAACAAKVRRLALRLRQPGKVEILRYDPSVEVALMQQVGAGRVAWRAGTALSVVQCVRVRRDGPLDGADVELLSVSAPIDREGSC